MTVNHQEFAERIADLDDLDVIPDDLSAHVDTCTDCAGHLKLARTIRSVARRSTVDVDATDDLVLAILSQTHPARRRRPRLVLAAAAAAALLIVGGSVAFIGRANNQSDVVADIAEELRTSDGTRFVLSVDSSVDLATEFNFSDVPAEPVEPLSVGIPRCDNEPADTAPTAGLDLAPIITALTDDDPCLALALIDKTVAQPASTSYTELSTSIERASSELSVIGDAEPDSQLVAASLSAFRTQRELELERAENARTQLRRSLSTLGPSLQPFAETDSGIRATAYSLEKELVAVQADHVEANAAIIPTDSAISWSQIATGTWKPNQIQVSGTTEQGDQETPFANVDDDPLGLISLILAKPETLLAILESAPSSDQPTVEWKVPDGTIPGGAQWTASVRQTSGRLDELILKSSNATMTFTPARQ